MSQIRAYSNHLIADTAMYSSVSESLRTTLNNFVYSKFIQSNSALSLSESESVIGLRGNANAKRTSSVITY